MRKGISLWLTSCLMRTHFASARETLRRGWITWPKICNYAFAKFTRDLTALACLPEEGLLIFLLLCLRYDYKIAREYNWNVKNKASKGYEENYFFIFRDGDGVYYNELETR